ncbi:MAG: hypothetical protein ACK2T0_04570 [Anaerolineales bacterium]
MPKLHPIQIALGLFAFACACRPTPAVPATSTPSSGAQGMWTVELSQTGGLVGVDLDVQVTSEGQLVATNRRSGRTLSSRITEAQSGELDSLYRAAISAQYADRPSTCADCYIYQLTLSSGHESRTIRLDDASMAGTAAEPLITFLIQLRDSALGEP